MTTISFDKNIVIKEPEAVAKLIKALLSEDVKPVNKEMASAEAMARGEEVLRWCLSLTKNI